MNRGCEILTERGLHFGHALRAGDVSGKVKRDVRLSFPHERLNRDQIGHVDDRPVHPAHMSVRMHDSGDADDNRTGLNECSAQMPAKESPGTCDENARVSKIGWGRVHLGRAPGQEQLRHSVWKAFRLGVATSIHEIVPRLMQLAGSSTIPSVYQQTSG